MKAVCTSIYSKYLNWESDGCLPEIKKKIAVEKYITSLIYYQKARKSPLKLKSFFELILNTLSILWVLSLS